MQKFTHYTPTEIIFGPGVEERTAELVKKHGGSRVMVVYGGGSVVESGLLRKIEALLGNEGIEYVLFGGAQPNPLLSHVREGVSQALKFGADMVLAIGGGSAIDTAKTIAHGLACPDEDIWLIWKSGQKQNKSLPVGVVLTIPAAGSETSDSAVLTNRDTGEKRGKTLDIYRPKFAIMNPELAYTLPSYQISCGITDIMMHTLDRYFTKIEGNELTSQIAEAVLRVTMESGRKALKNPRDYDAMSELMWCGSISHDGTTGLGAIPDFSVHQLGHELSGMFDISHGASLSTMWGAWAEYTCKEKPERFARYAEKVWSIDIGGDIERTAIAGIEKTVEFFKSINMPTCFSEAQMGLQADSVITELALRCSYDETRLVGQFKKLDRNDLYNIYTIANR